ncbi:type IV toxin-antitoxin system AbiEi family antitoxin domain-containing protein [Variovorax paradoxus]|uniref:type IV toxin-antitoxin system AbiEi family antitoxin domain-containing protein n=1 Tax=Variovorax paradoxus TaxID=34073 RepID=UPI003D64944A
MTRSLQECLSKWERPVITDYELGSLAAGQAVALRVEISAEVYTEIVRGLASFGLISPSKGFKAGTVFHLFGHVKPSPMEVACAVDPFAYVSHLSAMEYHGITDRFSKILYLSTPPDKEWKEQAAARMDKDRKKQAQAYLFAELPSLRYQKFERVDGMRVELMRRSHRGAFKIIKSPAIRVAMIGRTFLDMLREPEYCGGMQHVVDTYREYASKYLRLIIDEVSRHGKSIEQARAGYLLEEVCGLNDPQIDDWASKVQRGGSRKLDPQEEYASVFSERWMLSLNVPSLASPDSV